MATYDVTEEVATIVAAGGVLITTSIGGQLSLEGIAVVQDGDTYECFGRRDQAAIEALAYRASAPAPAPRAVHLMEAPATDRQIDYIMDLLAAKARGGYLDEPGFVDHRGYILPDGRFDMDRLRSLTKAQASALISSLKGDY